MVIQEDVCIRVLECVYFCYHERFCTVACTW